MAGVSRDFRWSCAALVRPVNVRASIEKQLDETSETKACRVVQRGPSRARPTAPAAGNIHFRTAFDEQTRDLRMSPKKTGVKRRHAERMFRNTIDVRSSVDQPFHRLTMAEV